MTRNYLSGVVLSDLLLEPALRAAEGLIESQTQVLSTKVRRNVSVFASVDLVVCVFFLVD